MAVAAARRREGVSGNPDLKPGNGTVGQFGAQNALVLDHLLRLQGSIAPNVIRAAPISDDAPTFTGTRLAAAGAVTRIKLNRETPAAVAAPFAARAAGQIDYLGSIYRSYGRYVYAAIDQSF